MSRGRALLVITAGSLVVLAAIGVVGVLPAHRSDATALVDGQPVTLEAAANEVVRGQTSLSPGTTVAIRLHPTDGSVFYRARTTRVGAGGRFGAAFNLSAVPTPATVRVTVTHGHRVLIETSGRIVA